MSLRVFSTSHTSHAKSKFYTDVVRRFQNGVFSAVGGIPNQEQPLTVADYCRMTCKPKAVPGQKSALLANWGSILVPLEIIRLLVRSTFHKTFFGSPFIRLVDCRRFCDGQTFHVQHESTIFNKERATGSISINYKLQISIDFHNARNLVRDQGVGGSNPLSPTIFFQAAH